MSILTAITGVAAPPPAEPTKPSRSLKAIATKRRQAFDTSVADASSFVVEITELADMLPSVTTITPELEQKIAAIRERRVIVESYRHDVTGGYRVDRRAEEFDRLHARKQAWLADIVATKHETIGLETISLPKLESVAYRDGARSAGRVLARSYSDAIATVEADQQRNEETFQHRLDEADEVASIHPYVAQLLEAKGSFDRWIAETRNYGLIETTSFGRAALAIVLMLDRRTSDEHEKVGRAFLIAEDWMLHRLKAVKPEAVAARKGK